MKWKTKNGEMIEVKDMETPHLKHTLNFLYKRAFGIREIMEINLLMAETTLRGQMALSSIENQQEQLAKTSDKELVEEHYPIVLNMIAELKKRGEVYE